jgi:hypothetical protein
MVFLSYYFETAGLDSVEYDVGGTCRVNGGKINFARSQ